MSTDPGPPGGPFILTLSCPDRPRIVNEVTGFLVKHSGNIRESQLFVDPDTDHFFMRIMFDLADHHVDANTLRADFEAVAEAFDMTFQLWAARAPHRTLILVSKHLHCLNDLLFRWGTGSLQIEIPAIVSNHKDAARLAASYDVPFHHVPVTPEPIIEQDTLRVDHGYSERQLVTAGRDVEAQVLSRAVRWHAESRVLMNGSRTVVFR